jgi:parvulin-like peptidyl-prolyl isomerase
MSFTDLKVADLRKVADTFAVDLGTEKSKAVIIAQLEEEGITYAMYEKFLGAEKEEIEVPAVEKKKREKTLKTEDTMLVKMERNNHSYQTMGYTFSADHPFVAMSITDAQKIFDTETGFRVATPREAQEYYA